ncbi:MAG: class C sortase [Eubacteriales bacterium]|nr:class C sortase [Eubacteriales bacterium]
MAKGKKKKKSSVISNLLLFVGFLIGAGILLYPTLSDLWNSYRNKQLISNYTSVVEEMKPEDYSKIWEDAREYNAQHRVNTILDAFDEEKNDYVLTHPYDQLLNPMGNEIMGYLEIPKIGVELAIYHGVGVEALENGCGHIEGTSLPIGGVGDHAVLSAHRGLPSAKLFTDLDQMEKGDLFLLKILDETFAYRVDQILTVLPEETEALAIEEGKDLVTLVTCTPYGVNSHRLLVRGERTDYVPEEVASNNNVVIRNPLEGATDRRQQLLIMGLVAFIVFLFILNMILGIRDRRRKRRRQQEAAKKKQDEQS